MDVRRRRARPCRPATLATFRRRLALSGGCAALLALAACGSSSSSEAPSESSSAGGGVPLLLTARDYTFDPTTLSAGPNAQVTVRLQNKGAHEHSFTTTSGVTADVEADPGETKSVSFTLPSSGVVTFHCKYHPTMMTGTIVIGPGAMNGAVPSAAPTGNAGPALQAPGPGSSAGSGPAQQNPGKSGAGSY